VLGRQPGGGVAAVEQEPVEHVQGVAGQEHQRGVQHVLAGGPHVDGDRVARADRVLQDPDQRWHRVAGVRGLAHHPGEVEAGRVGAGGGDGVGRRGRHEPEPRRRPGQGRLDPQERAQPRLVGEHAGHRAAREGPVEEAGHPPDPARPGQIAKKTVSPSPRSRMSSR
jgi:hypothetical protein